MFGRIGVCSWSLQPGNPLELASRIQSCAIQHTQLALDPLRTHPWNPSTTRETLGSHTISIISGMMACKNEDYTTLESIEHTGGVRLDSTWADNLEAAHENAKIAHQLGLSLVTFHAGFLPKDHATPERAILIDRINAVVDEFSAKGIHVALETGQETAETLVGVLKEINRPELGVNFDPANMILYAKGEPIPSMQALAPWIRQVHIKDALPARTPGTWGEEVRAGTGAVNWREFLGVVRELDRPIDLVIEREAGEQRIADVTAAREMLDRLMR